MRPFRDRPIHQKLVLVIVATTTFAMLMAGAGIALADSVLFRGYVQRDLSALVRIIADNSTAALSFNDPKAATETLATLRARPHVEGACVYRLNGTTFATYSRDRSFACPASSGNYGIRFTAEDIVVSHAILLNGKEVGSLILLYDQGELYERMRIYGSTVLGVMLFAGLLAVAFSSRLRASITAPISQLVRTTESVSSTGDYGIRAQKLSGDELGILADRLNEMLAGIQSRDNDLKGALADREAALRTVEEERERFHFMAESMPQKIFTANANGEVTYFNRQWVEFTGLSFEQLQNWEWTDFLHPDDGDTDLRARLRQMKSGEPFHVEHRFRQANGEYRWHLSRVHALRDASGKISMWIGSNTDIHEQKEKQEELRRLNEDLQQFAYSASHDLQEPIRNVAIFSELVATRYSDVVDGEGQIFLGFLREGGQRLARLISDLLAYTRAGAAEITPVPVNSTEALQHALSNLAEAMRESGGEVTADALPEVCMGEAHLQQVFQNLIGNSLKYRKEQPPQIHVSAKKRGSLWCFSVEDNGIGIDPMYKEKIFGVFKRLHHDEKYSGTGIGLAICQRVVERYGGRIWVESEAGKGATFFSPSRDTENPSDQPRFNLLLAEDNLPDALLVREAVRRENLPLDIHLACDGQEAIDFITGAETDPAAPCPHFLLLDINLPKADGFEVLRRLRSSERCREVPVIVISSSDSVSDRQEAASLGASYFRKPPNYEEFLKLGGILRRLLTDKGLI